MKADIQIDPALVKRCRRGSTEAFAELVEQLKRPAYFHALSLTGNREDAMDVSQDAFVRAWRNIRSVDADRPFYAWYYTILKRLALNCIRQRERRREEPGAEWLLEQKAADADPAGRHQQQLETRMVQRVLMRLPLTEREILCLKDMHEHSYRDIAAILAIPAGTVMSRLYTARRHFRQLIEETVHDQA